VKDLEKRVARLERKLSTPAAWSRWGPDFRMPARKRRPPPASLLGAPEEQPAPEASAEDVAPEQQTCAEPERPEPPQLEYTDEAAEEDYYAEDEDTEWDI